MWQCAASLRRGGTFSVPGVYAGPVRMFPPGDLFDMRIQLGMGPANVGRWALLVLPLLEDEDSLGAEGLGTHAAFLRDAPRTTGCSREGGTER